MTLYVFSSENWGRPSKEVDYLMNLLIEMVVKEIPDLMAKNVKLTVIGNMNRIPEKPRASLQSAIDITANNTGMQLNLAISYGGRQEIVEATKSIASQVAAGTLKVDEIDETLFAKNLYLKGAPDPDLVIRTGGEFRLSNYLLWQAAYSEFYVTDTLWPDFTKEEFMKAVEFFNTRERRFGKVLHE
jgi:undecaprenyl diphosphate synthase